MKNIILNFAFTILFNLSPQNQLSCYFDNPYKTNFGAFWYNTNRLLINTFYLPNKM